MFRRCSKILSSGVRVVGGGIIYLDLLVVWASWTSFLIFHFNWNFLEIQLFFSISLLPSIALKRWNLPDNLDFKVKDKIMAKFLIRSPLSLEIKGQWNNKLNTGLFKKYITCIIAFFIPFNFVALYQFYYTTSPVLFPTPP